jgi:hypothetical protein
VFEEDTMRYEITTTPSGNVYIYREAARDARTVVALSEGTRTDCLVATVRGCGHVSETWMAGLPPAKVLADAGEYRDLPCYYCKKIAQRSDVEWSLRKIDEHSGGREWATIDAFVDARMTRAIATPYGVPVVALTEGQAVRALRRLARQHVDEQIAVDDDLAAYGAPQECYDDVRRREAHRLLQQVKRTGIDPERLVTLLGEQASREAEEAGQPTMAWHEGMLLDEALRSSGAVRGW